MGKTASYLLLEELATGVIGEVVYCLPISVVYLLLSFKYSGRNFDVNYMG